MVGTSTRSSATAVAAQHPIRQSPRKSSNPSAGQPVHPSQAPHLLPTPLSNSPSTSSNTTHVRYPPQFDHSHPMNYAPVPNGPASLSHSVSVSARASTALYTPRSPYRPGEYGRRPETASERTKIERRLFGEEEDEMARMREEEEEEEGRKRNRGSSPLQPAFEARLILRKGAPVDLISWLRRNFHHIPSPSHPSLTSSTSLLAIRALLAERFPRLPESEELVKAVTAAFPRVHMDYGPVGSEEPPMIRGLVWNGKETVYEDTRGEKEKRLSLESAKGKGAGSPTPEKRGAGRMGRNVSGSTTNVASASAVGNGPGSKHAVYTHANRPPTSISTGNHHNPGAIKSNNASRSPTQSTLVSPTTSSSRRLLPNTPARSVLEEFAVLATLADKTPVTKTQSLPGDRMVVPSMAYKLASICDSFGGSGSPSGEQAGGRLSSKRRPSSGVNGNGKRRASTPPLMGDNNSITPDKLEGLLAAAETIEGSPMASFLDNPDEGRGALGQHKRRRTIGGMGSMREVIEGGKAAMKARGGLGVEESPGKKGSGRMLGALEFVPEDRGELGSVSDAEQTLDPAVKPKGRGRASAGTAGRGRGRGRGGKVAAAAKGRAHAESNASQLSLSAVSTIAHSQSGGIGDGGMYRDPGTPLGHGMSLGLGLAPGTGSTYPSGPSMDGTPHPGFSPSASTSASFANGQYPVPGPSSRSSSIPHPNYPRPRKSNELPTDGLYPGIDCKPPHPYHEMIRHAIEAAPERRLQLSQIYSSIAERFPFFAGLDERKTAGWQNSIRHNLSLKKMFVRVNKVDGIPDEGGKGGWWTVEPGIPDEGRPGRKSKSASAVAAAVAAGLIVDPLAGPAPAWKVAIDQAASASASAAAGSTIRMPVAGAIGDGGRADESAGHVGMLRPAL